MIALAIVGIRSVGFATQTISATVNEAPYILDGLLMTNAGQKVREQYADTGGFTDHDFAVTALLRFQFIPRIRDLPSKRLYIFDPASCPKELKGLIGGKVRDHVISSKLGRYTAQRGNHGGGRDAAMPTLAEICILSPTA